MVDKERKRIDPIVLGQEDRVTQAQRPAAKRRSPAKTSSGSGSGGFWKFLTFLVFVGIVVVGGYGWMLVTELKQELSTLQARFNGLEIDLTSQTGTLSETEAGLNQRLKEVSSTIETHWSEIRKLWGVSNDRNKKSIAQNDKDIEALKAGAKKLSQQLSSLNTNVSSMQQTVSSTTLGLKAEQDVLRQQLQDIADSINKQQSTMTSMANKLSKNDEAINAIDAYRRQVNQQLQRLERLIQQQAATSPATINP